MPKMFGAAVLMTLLASGPALAQPAPAGTPASTPGAAPAVATPPGVVATTNNPNLAVATLKLEHGQRVSKIVGATVYNDTSDKIGTVDDLIMTTDDKVTMAVISVGGFLGLGSKLVAVPWNQLRQDGDKIVLAGASKDSLNGMPNFEY